MGTQVRATEQHVRNTTRERLRGRTRVRVSPDPQRRRQENEKGPFQPRKNGTNIPWSRTNIRRTDSHLRNASPTSPRHFARRGPVPRGGEPHVRCLRGRGRGGVLVLKVKYFRYLNFGDSAVDVLRSKLSLLCEISCKLGIFSKLSIR